MNWKKRGLIFSPAGKIKWAKHSALTPTPLLLNEEIMRVYAGFRDASGISRIGYVDVDAQNPARIIRVSESPVLDLGQPGTFDDNGMMLGDVIRVGKEIWMYYAGFQLVDKIKFQAYTGLAISRDGGETFERLQRAPIMDRTEEALYIRTVHTVIQEDGIFKIWYCAGNDWIHLEGNTYANYDIKYVESQDGIHVPTKGVKCIDNDSRNGEYRIGRPRITKYGGLYNMYFTYSTLNKKVFSGYASSLDGKNWYRDDQKLGISLSDTGWDSDQISFPTVLSAGNKRFMFYNGNNLGYDGFGYAEQC